MSMLINFNQKQLIHMSRIRFGVPKVLFSECGRMKSDTQMDRLVL